MAASTRSPSASTSTSTSASTRTPPSSPSSPSSSASLTSSTRLPLLLLCVVGIYTCYMAYGYYQEKLTCTPIHGTDQTFDYPLFMMMCQCVVASFSSGVLLLVTGIPINPPPPPGGSLIRTFNLLAFTFLGGMISSYAALRFVNFPTMTLGKSVKMLPVMLIGMLFYGKKYPLRSYICMSLLALGVAGFFLLKPAKAGAIATDNPDLVSQMLGLALVLVSLLFDGLTGARQDDWTNRSTAPNGLQLMFGMNVWASAQLIAALLVTGQLREPLALVLAHPLLLLDMAAFCVISALGQKFIFLTVSSFSALACSIITTTRKFFTILASVVYFQHPLSVGQWLSVALVFIALGWDVMAAKSSAKSAATASGEGDAVPPPSKTHKE